MTRLQDIRRQIRNLQAEEQKIVHAQMPTEVAARNAEARVRRIENGFVGLQDGRT